MVRGALTPVLRGTQPDLDRLEKMDDDVDRLHAALITYLGRLSQENLSKRQSLLLHEYMAAANNMENIGDMVETNLVEAGAQRLKDDLRIGESTEERLNALHQKVVWAFEHTVESLVGADRQKAEEVMAAKNEINDLAIRAENHVASRLTANEPKRLEAFRIESEIIEYLKRVYYFSKRIAKMVAETEDDHGEPEFEPTAESAQQPQRVGSAD
jgi:phosphate:Na+ symporter